MVARPVAIAVAESEADWVRVSHPCPHLRWVDVQAATVEMQVVVVVVSQGSDLVCSKQVLIAKPLVAVLTEVAMAAAVAESEQGCRILPVASEDESVAAWVAVAWAVNYAADVAMECWVEKLAAVNCSAKSRVAVVSAAVLVASSAVSADRAADRSLTGNHKDLEPDKFPPTFTLTTQHVLHAIS